MLEPLAPLFNFHKVGKISTHRYIYHLLKLCQLINSDSCFFPCNRSIETHLPYNLYNNSEKAFENIVVKGDKRAMMALNCSPESVSPQNEFYLLYYYCSNL